MDNSMYNVPLYSIADASRYLRTHSNFLKSLMDGSLLPSIIHVDDPQRLSFINLVEAFMLRSVFNDRYVFSLDEVRLALDHLKEYTKNPHPLAIEQFKHNGIDIFVYELGQIASLSQCTQFAIEHDLRALTTCIEWDRISKHANCLYPIIGIGLEPRDTKAVCINPLVENGHPVITNKNIQTRVVSELYENGDYIDNIATSHGLAPSEVMSAIFFESNPFN
jgi:uncharacterized protein (DUF433 family)